MVTQVGTEVRSVGNIQSMARALHAGQTRNPQQKGEYSFSSQGQGVWELDSSYENSSLNQRIIPIGDWLAGLAVVCGLEMRPSELSELGFQIGLQVGQDSKH